MLTKTVDVNAAEISVKELLSLVQVDTEIVLTEGGIPLARLVPIVSGNELPKAGLHPGAIEIGDDFDEPLPDEFWTGST